MAGKLIIGCKLDFCWFDLCHLEYFSGLLGCGGAGGKICGFDDGHVGQVLSAGAAELVPTGL